MLPVGNLFSEGIVGRVARSIGEMTVFIEEGGEVVGARVEEAGDSHHSKREGGVSSEGWACHREVEEDGAVSVLAGYVLVGRDANRPVGVIVFWWEG